MTDLINKPKITIAIAEDHELYRTSLEIALRQNPRWEIIWLASDGKNFQDFFSVHIPDLVLMDIGLPVINGIDLTRFIKSASRATKVIMLTARDEDESLLKALKAGADAYCTKSISFDKLDEVIDSVLEGAIWLDPAIANYLYGFIQETSISDDEGNLGHNLSPREIEVLELMVQGLSNKEISKKLFITIHTVKAHVCSTIQKLSAKDRTDAAVKAVKYKIVS